MLVSRFPKPWELMARPSPRKEKGKGGGHRHHHTPPAVRQPWHTVVPPTRTCLRIQRRHLSPYTLGGRWHLPKAGSSLLPLLLGQKQGRMRKLGTESQGPGSRMEALGHQGYNKIVQNMGLAHKMLPGVISELSKAPHKESTSLGK